jgi:hypothetical protein
VIASSVAAASLRIRATVRGTHPSPGHVTREKARAKTGIVINAASASTPKPNTAQRISGGRTIGGFACWIGGRIIAEAQR